MRVDHAEAGLEPGAPIAVRESWRGQLWSAAPHRVVEHGELLVTYLAAGAVTAHATNRGLPQVEGMARSERKLEAMRTGEHTVTEHSDPWSSLHFFTPGCWARVWFSWDESGAGVGHYVNFERPYAITDDGIDTKDLVLDALIREGEWSWKDQGDFDEAIRLGIFDETLRGTLADTADEVRRWLESGSGPFDRRWSRWRPDPSWPVTKLPPDCRAGGSRWTPSR